VRKDFTVSECVAIGKALVEQAGERRGGSGEARESKRQKFDVCQPGERTDDAAARLPGSVTAPLFEQAASVVNAVGEGNAVPALREAMDNETPRWPLIPGLSCACARILPIVAFFKN
jgi:hypothetical protein